jgi:hypothetical protein
LEIVEHRRPIFDFSNRRYQRLFGHERVDTIDESRSSHLDFHQSRAQRRVVFDFYIVQHRHFLGYRRIDIVDVFSFSRFGFFNVELIYLQSPIHRSSSLRRSFVTFTCRKRVDKFFYRFQFTGNPLQFFFATDGFHPIPFLRDRLYLEEIADAAREESERIGRCTPLLSRVGWHPSDIRLNDTSMSTPEASDSTEQQGSPIPADEDSVEIDVADVEYEQTYAPGTTTATSLSRRALELTDIEVSFKRGVTSALHQRPLFVLDKADIITADATAFQLQASRWTNNFVLKEVIAGRAVDQVQICIDADNAFTLLPESDLPRWLDLLTVPQAAELVIKYFGPRPDSGRTLTENFGNVSFDFSFSILPPRERR